MREFGVYPIDETIPSIHASLKINPTCLIKAEPGAGKTTRVPLSLLEVYSGQIWVLEPRRLAARLSAERTACFLEESCGQTVGYRIRHEAKVSEATRLLFITEGLFLRLLSNNPLLQGVDVIVLDEFHERNVYTDLALALVRQLQETHRPDLRLVVMSATLDTPLLEDYLFESSVFDVAGRTFPVEIEYHPNVSSGRRGIPWENHLTEKVEQMLEDPRCSGNILIFFSGLSDIMKASRSLKNRLSKEIQVLPLASTLSPSDQQKALAENHTRKVILSTNVAETSLTLHGITGVIDLGIAKISAHASWSGMPTLETQPISQASCIQRAGRAGRVKSGLVYRLYSENDFLRRPAFSLPEVQRVELAQVLLELDYLGHSHRLLPWLETPHEKNIEAAETLLVMLGALDKNFRITELGKKMASLPLHPRLSAIVFSGISEDYGENALLASCLLNEGFILRRGESFGAGEKALECDVGYQMDLFKSIIQQDSQSTELRMLVDEKQLQKVFKLYQSLAPLLGFSKQPPREPTSHNRLIRCLLKGYPDRIAGKRQTPKGKKKTTEQSFYHFCLGRGGLLDSSTVLFRSSPDFILALDAMESLQGNAAKGITVRVASQVPLSLLKEEVGHFLKTEKSQELNKSNGKVQVFETLFYGKLKLESRVLAPEESDTPLVSFLEECWPYPFEDLKELDTYHAKIECLLRYGVETSCPVFEGEMLSLFWEALCDGKKSLQELANKTLKAHIQEQLSWQEKELLERQTPDQIRLPNGKTLQITYSVGQEPSTEMLIQDLYGVQQTPALFGGKAPLRLVLLGPNHRPAQVTNDLVSFWKGSYHAVKKELKRRYPKHHWPEEPQKAPPILLVKNLPAPSQ